MANKGILIGSVLKSREGHNYIKINMDIQFNKGTTFSLEDPRSDLSPEQLEELEAKDEQGNPVGKVLIVEGKFKRTLWPNVFRDIYFRRKRDIDPVSG